MYFTWIVVDSCTFWQAVGRQPDLRPVLFRVLQVRRRRHPDVPEIRRVPAHERGGEEPRPGLAPRSHGEGLPLPLYPIPVDRRADLTYSLAKIHQNWCPFPPLNTSERMTSSEYSSLVLSIEVLLKIITKCCAVNSILTTTHVILPQISSTFRRPSSYGLLACESRDH